MTRRRGLYAAAALLLAGQAAGLALLPAGCRRASGAPALRVVVMDPLADRLACACVAGYAQRKYDRLGTFLSRRLVRPVVVDYCGDLGALPADDPHPHLIIGKDATVRSDARESGLSLRSLARLTDPSGQTALTGLFVVPTASPVHALADLKGKRILLGPESSEEKSAAAVEALRDAGVPLPDNPPQAPGCTSAAGALLENEADAAVISSYAYVLLEGCGTVDKGALRVIGRTAPVPFVTVFATDVLPAGDEAAVRAALEAVRNDRNLLRALESRAGFVLESAAAPPAQPAPAAEPDRAWPDWRGARREGLSAWVPRTLPEEPHILWRAALSGASPGGVSADAEVVIVSDKDADGRRDLWRCLDARTGAPRWTLAYDAPGEMDFTNAPRATPVLHADRAYLLGAFGHLHCVDRKTGEVLWKTHLVDDLGGVLATWGYCATPLLHDGRLIVNPGGPGVALAALDPNDGAVLWRTPGGAAAYASFVVLPRKDAPQIIGYDAESLGGWDARTGRRLWTLTPAERDFNVPTPLVLGERILVATERNGTRLYELGPGGQLGQTPLASSRSLKPDTATPVVVKNRVYGCANELVCLDLHDGLRELWHNDDEPFNDYFALIGGNERVLIATAGGELLLLDASVAEFRLAGRLRVFEDADIWSHPALVRGRLYLRDRKELVCVALD